MASEPADSTLRHLAEIVESSAVAIYSIDLNATITSWNHAAERLFGYTASEAMGGPVIIIVPSERQFEEEEVLRRIRAGESMEHYESVRRRKDGTLFDVKSLQTGFQMHLAEPIDPTELVATVRALAKSHAAD